LLELFLSLSTSHRSHFSATTASKHSVHYQTMPEPPTVLFPLLPVVFILLPLVLLLPSFARFMKAPSDSPASPTPPKLSSVLPCVFRRSVAILRAVFFPSSSSHGRPVGLDDLPDELHYLILLHLAEPDS
jgi:hypothetical protein